MNISPYTTSVGKSYILTGIQRAFDMARANNEAEEVLPGIWALHNGQFSADAQPFYQLIMESDWAVSGGLTPSIIFDARQMVSVDRGTGKRVVRDQARYNLMLFRAKIAKRWMNESTSGFSKLYNFSEIPMRVFARLLSDMITARRQLAMDINAKLQIIAGFFYCCQFINEELLTDERRDDFTAVIFRAIRTHMTYDAVRAMLDDVPYIGTLRTFHEVASLVTDSMVIREVGPAVINGWLGGYWPTEGRGETIRVAIEHPPTWFSLCYAAYADRGFSTSALSKLTRAPGISKDRADYDTFLKNMTYYAEGSA